jgi:FSR family fosmidomycin resistance protein-like MFS transporter
VVALFGLQGLTVLIVPALVMAVVLRKVLPPGENPVPDPGTGMGQPLVSFSPLASLFAASTLRAWAVFTAIAFFPPLLVSRGFDLFSANLLMTLMLFAGVAGQISGGILADRYGKKEFTITSLLCSVPFLFLFLGSTGLVSYLALILFGLFLWSSFAVTVAMSHEIMPSRVGMASGLMLGVAIGAGGIGVAINGMIADMYSLATALYTIPILIVGAAVVMILVRYPWRLDNEKEAV